MKNIRFLLITVFIVSIFYSCKKDKYPKIIQGTVTDITTQKVVPNATIYLYDVEGGIMGWSHSLYDSLLSNRSGNFNYSLEDDINLDILIDHPDYAKSDWFHINKEDYDKINLEIQPIGYLSIHCFDIDTIPGDGISLAPFLTVGPFIPTYINDTIVVGQVYGNATNEFSYTTNGNQSFVSIYCNAFDTTYYEIKY